MRHLPTLALLAWSAVSSAQCTVDHFGLDPLSQPMRPVALDLSNAERFSVLKLPTIQNSSTIGEQTVVICRQGDDGSLIWQRSITAANTTFRLAPCGVMNTSDGGGVIYGDLHHVRSHRPEYNNQFAIRVDPQGDVEWARIYMLYDSCQYNNQSNIPGLLTARSNGMVELADGRLSWLLLGCSGIYTMHIAADGTPLDGHLLHNEEAMARTHQGIPLRDGGFFGCHSVQNGRIFRTSDDGTVLWTRLLDQPWQETDLFHWALEQFPTSETYLDLSGLLETTNGDILFHAAIYPTSVLYRFAPNGEIIWSRSLGDPSNQITPGTLAELADGTILIRTMEGLFQLAGDGNGPVEKWLHTDGIRLVRSQPGQGATVALSPQNNDLPVAKAVRVQNALDLTEDCGFLPGVMPNVAASGTAAVLLPGGVQTEAVTQGSWTMSIADETAIGPDLMAIGGIGFVRPGFSTRITAGAMNTSIQMIGATTITCTVPPELTVSLVFPPATQVAGNVYTWEVPEGLGALSQWHFQMDAILLPDPELIGTTLSCIITAQHAGPDANSENNTFVIARTITGAYDPNDKLVRTSSGTHPDIYVPTLDSWLDYTINFQNTGNDTAFTVVITDTLEHTLSPTSFMAMGASHAYSYVVDAAGVVTFTFPNILLVDSNMNEPLSHGCVHFRIKPKAGSPLGTTITNRADIFFDFNPPIRTPDVVVTIDMGTGIQGSSPASLSAYPVPVHDILHVQLPQDLMAERLAIRTLEGRVVRTERPGRKEGTIQLSVQDLAPGTYLLTLDGPRSAPRSTRFVKW